MTTKNKSLENKPAVEKTHPVEAEGAPAEVEQKITPAAEETVAEKTTMESFFTRPTANAGVKLPLYLPDGTASEHYMVVLGADSDVFRKSEMEAKRSAAQIAQIDDTATRDALIMEEELGLVASLVSTWSFSQECNKQNVVAFLKEAPHIADNINTFAAKRSNFIKKKNKDLLTGFKKNSN